MIAKMFFGARKLGKRKESENAGRKVLIASAGTALATYFFDPRLGRTRRAQLAGRIGGLFRRGAREATRKTEYAKGQMEGLKHVAGSDSAPPTDTALADKVESEVLSRWNYPKGRINVNAVDGVVELRGVCDTPDQITDLEREVRKVTGVVDVHNYLHLPHTPAPNKQEAMRAGS